MWSMVRLIFRSPLTLTLKFGAEKNRERESKRESERARARESKLLYLRSQVVVVVLLS